ncbi:MAG: hypothetical protein JW953_01450 [Anaerolineae bacterium]|nr:hypothetical protein [Anaerolineae bacterium]
MNSTQFHPARGLLRLTWPQIELIDQLIDQLCQSTGEEGSGTLVLEVKRGKLRFAEYPLRLRTELQPNRE